MQAAAPDTELERLRRRVAELEDRVAELEVSLDSVPILISYVSGDQRYRRVNRAHHEILAVPSDGVVGRSIEELTGEPHYSNAKQYITRALRGEQVTFHSFLVYKDGSLHEVEVTYAPHTSGTDRVKGVVICMRDVTEERRAQIALRERERDLLSVLNNVPDVISRYNRELRFVFTSASVERHTGFAPEHFAGKTHAEIGFPAGMCAMLDDSLRDIFATGKPQPVCFEFLGPNGLRQYEAVGSPEFAEDGTVASVLTVTHDVTSRIQAEQELRRSEERQRLAVEAGRVGLWHWDVRTNRVEWSDFIYDLHGLQPGEFGGTVEDFVDLIHPDDRDLVAEALSRAMAGTSDYHVEFRAKRPDGAIRWIFANGKVGFENNRPVHMLGAMLDMTESKTAAEALARANEDLRRANEDLNQFAYSASHDLKEPLRMIGLYTQILQRKYFHEVEAEAAQYMRYIVSGVTRMDNLLHDLLLYTQAIGSGTDPVTESVDMANVLDKVRANLSLLIAETEAAVTSDTLPVLRWREAHAVQVLQNLISNAIKYRDPERPPRIHITAEEHLRSWQFAVADNAIGVDARYQDRIFGMFKRLHTSARYEGTGIGLAICRTLVERNGGRIWIESELGCGSTFYFTCPVA